MKQEFLQWLDPITAQVGVHNPCVPKVFILNGDGTGMELIDPISPELDEAREQQDCTMQRKEQLQLTTIIKNLHQTYPFKDDTFTPFCAELEFGMQLSATSWPLLKSHSIHIPSPQTPVATYAVQKLQWICHSSDKDILQAEKGMKEWSQWWALCQATAASCIYHNDQSEEEKDDECSMQKKILLAYKAARAKQKAEKMKAKEKAKDLEMMEAVIIEEDDEVDLDDELVDTASENSQEELEVYGPSALGFVEAAMPV